MPLPNRRYIWPREPDYEEEENTTCQHQGEPSVYIVRRQGLFLRLIRESEKDFEILSLQACMYKSLYPRNRAASPLFFCALACKAAGECIFLRPWNLPR